jgi:hypothetical protein
VHRGTGWTDGRTVDVDESESSDWLAVRWAVDGKTGGALRTEYEALAYTLQQYLAESSYCLLHVSTRSKPAPCRLQPWYNWSCSAMATPGFTPPLSVHTLLFVPLQRLVYLVPFCRCSLIRPGPTISEANLIFCCCIDHVVVITLL